ncbi:hypothetical protein EOL94_00645 [bacterium]|nr:hypothetical protein [bacterium]
MKKLMFLFCVLFTFIACKKEADFKKVDIFDMRISNIETSFSYDDCIIEINDSDTIGQTKLLLNEEIVCSCDWQSDYQSSKHVKTGIKISKLNNLELVVLGHFYEPSKLFIVESGLLKKQSELIFSPLQIKTIEVDESNREIKIVGNKTWTRTPEHEDEEVLISY